MAQGLWPLHPIAVVTMRRLAFCAILHVCGIAGLMMPEEAAQQTRVFMSAASSTIWGDDTAAVQGALALLANTLVKYQPVAIYVSPRDVVYMTSQLNSSVEMVEFQALACQTQQGLRETPNGEAGIGFLESV